MTYKFQWQICLSWAPGVPGLSHGISNRRQPQDSTPSQFTYSSSQFLRVFRSMGWLGFLWWTPFSPSSSPSSLGIQHWLGFLSGVHNNPSGFGPSVNLHKVDLVTHAHLGHLYYSVTICESNLLWYMKWYVFHTILRS